MIRTDGRAHDELRPVRMTRGFIETAEGSVLVEFGMTKVICTASFEDNVPGWMKGSKNGWVTAEYSMLPRSTNERTRREAVAGRQSGRTMEIQRLIGRSLRAATDLTAFPGCSFLVDCDVIQADGGTRTAAITGAYVALRDAFSIMIEEGELKRDPSTAFVAAVSAGVVGGAPCLDLCYEEDLHADVDFNLVANDRGEILEIQGTSEHSPLVRADLNRLVDLGLSGIERLIAAQKEVLGL